MANEAVDQISDPTPLFFLSVASKGLNVLCKWFRINTCGHFLYVLILKGLTMHQNCASV